FIWKDSCDFRESHLFREQYHRCFSGRMQARLFSKRKIERKNTMKMELRVQNTELDANSDGVLKVSGYVNKTNQHSEILGTTKRFKEKIAKGAFSKAIRAAKQINFLAEHNPKKILA